MYRIIIADDEPLIVRGLKKMMKWGKMDTEVVGEAEDGGQLLNLLGTLEPDIIISDISMPEKTGLDVLKEIKQRKLKTKVIFLSGFQEFSYAKEAVTYGAVDYLLKPVSVEELENAINRAKDQIVQEQPEAVWKIEQQNVENVFKEISDSPVKRKKRKLHISRKLLNEGKHFAGICFALKGDLVQRIQDNNRFELMRFSVFKAIEEYLEENRNGFVTRRSENSSNIILALSSADFQSEIRAIISRIREIIYGKYGVELVAGIGEITTQADKVEYLYQTAKFSAGIYYFTQEDTIYYQNIERMYNYSFEEFEKKCKEMTQKMLGHDETWRDSFDENLKIIRNLNYGSRYAVESRCNILAMNVCHDLLECKVIDEKNREKLEREVEALRGQNTYEDLKKKFKIIMERFVNECVFCKGSQENDSIFKVKEYISEHFNEDITLEKMAHMVYMNPYYFSAFFKKETGENFKAYLLEIRMKKALQYLMETDMKTYELACLTGYKDVRTFTEKFRDFYGYSPAKYKKNLR